MEIKKATIIYFSPTGGTKKVVLLLAPTLGIEVEELDIISCEPEKCNRMFAENELVLFGIPVFGGRMPEPAIEKIKGMQGNNTPAVLVAVYGNRAYEDALLELNDLVTGRGFIPAAAVAAVAEHSIMRHFAMGRPDNGDAAVLEYFGQLIMERLYAAESANQLPVLDIPGGRPYREYNGVPFKPETGMECIKCGLCTKHCPVGAIPVDNPSITDIDRCISCMGCISVCPVHARKLNPKMLDAAEKANEERFRERRENAMI